MRIAWLKLAPSPELIAAAGSHRSDAKEPAERGQITDRRGRVLAASLMSRRLYVDPAFIWERGWERVRKAQKLDPASEASADPFRDVALAIGGVLGVPPARIETELRAHPEDRYLVLEERLNDAQVEELRAMHLAGVGIESWPERIYPAGQLAAQVVGRVGTEAKGQAGAELRHEKALDGTDGNLGFVRDVQRRPLWIDDRDYREPDDGDTVRLTIDLVVQEIVERNLNAAVKRYKAGGGRCVVMDVETGDILAIAEIGRAHV